ncbi:Triosephosphate isomerase [Candidatus Bilamarchaeum dharawalense]|uniref:Triosephosphate isomerase n=1 Tax=Candidatus Bilamarchaeum dharawalense TaxID=2885759 RepID=A0A5E4LVY7_9ARCH|nr:Triosephosphate isomerase [Candidatus Bilamarchaeum dharawalense]
MIVLNLKTYPETIEKTLLFAEIAKEVVEESGVRIVTCPPAAYLQDAAQKTEVFAQHADPQQPGAFTGSVPVELLKYFKVKGSLVNHSEKKLPLEVVRATSERLHMVGLESLVCAASTKEAVDIAQFCPTIIAVEPPELIGSGVSVSKANPEIVINSVKAVKEVNHKITVLCGAGVSNKEDVQKALELGSEGVLLASAFVKAKDPKVFLKDLVAAF